MIKTYVSSSNIDALGYAMGKLFVLFKSGATYQYEPVNFTTFDRLCKAESVGSLFHKLIKSDKSVRYTKLESMPN